MSGSEQYEKVSVSSDGVTVDKRFEEDEFPVPAIAFEIQSARSEAVTVTLVDRVPEEIAVEDLGFHPEYGSEHWSIDEDRITFEREFEAGAEYTTVYGIRATGTDDIEQFLTEPTIEEVDPPLDGDDIVDESSSEAVRDVISDSDAGTGPDEADEPDEDDEDVDTLDLKDPNEVDDGGGRRATAATSATAGTAGGDASDASDGLPTDVDAESLVGALAAELRNGNVDEEDVKLLRKAFDVVEEDSVSVEARIKRLQTEISDLQAYTDALEAFLDENGTAEDIEEFRDEVDDLESELEELEELARGHEEVLSEVESTVENVEESMESLESEMDEALGEVETVESDVEDLESRVGDIDIEDVRDDVDDLESDIEEIKAWREQLSSVIGGGGNGGE